MAFTESNMIDIGTLAPNFDLPDTISHQRVSWVAANGTRGTLVYFICNHCPYVIHTIKELVQVAKDYRQGGINAVAISSNDVRNYPQDRPDLMTEFAKEYEMDFPYLYDEDQSVAKAYDAACTPDIYLFDGEDKLYYRGRLDEHRVKSGTASDGKDLRAALDRLLAGDPPPDKQYPSAGCGIKWKG